MTNGGNEQMPPNADVRNRVFNVSECHPFPVNPNPSVRAPPKRVKTRNVLIASLRGIVANQSRHRDVHLPLCKPWLRPSKPTLCSNGIDRQIMPSNAISEHWRV
jgi:hypothetical protein